MMTETNEQTFLYDAFIAFANETPDKTIANKLQKSLLSYRTPHVLVKTGKLRRLSRLVLDPEPQNEELSEAVNSALTASRFLIVVCSPRAKESVRLKDIIEYFKADGKEERILPLLIEGEPKDAFPPALFGERKISLTNSHGEIEEVPVEPLATDIRAGSFHKSLARIRPMRLKLIAAMIGCGYDDLEQRHMKRMRRRVVVATAVVAVASLGLISVFTTMTLNAIHQKKIAEKQTQMATELLNSMFQDLPEKFKDIPEAKPVLEGLFLDNIRALRVSGSQSLNIKKVDIEAVLRVKSGDSAKMVLRKARLLREFGRKREALEALDSASKAPDSVLPPEYFRTARIFTQAGYLQGEYIQTIENAMPAAANGMKTGDVIIELNRSKVGEYNDLWEQTNKLPFDGKVTVTYLRLQKNGSFIKRSFSTKLRDGMLGLTYEAI